MKGLTGNPLFRKQPETLQPPSGPTGVYLEGYWGPLGLGVLGVGGLL